MNAHRVPIGSAVRLTLSRRIPQPQQAEITSPPVSPVESDQYMTTTQIAPHSTLLSLNSEGVEQNEPPQSPPHSPPPSPPIYTPSPSKAWETDDESSSSHAPGSRTPKSSPRQKKRFLVSPLPSPDLQSPPPTAASSLGFRFEKTPREREKGRQPSGQSTTNPSPERKSLSNSPSDESETNESYDSNGPDTDDKTIPRSSIGHSHPRQNKGDTYAPVSPMFEQPISDFHSSSLDQILNEIRFDSLPNILRSDYKEDQDLISQWERELTLLEDEEDEDEERNLYGGDTPFTDLKLSQRCQDLEAELLKTKSDLLSSQTSRAQMASHIDLLTGEINELKERSLAMVRLLSYFPAYLLITL